MASGGTVTYSAVFNIDPSTSGVISSTASVANFGEPDPDPSNDSMTESTRVAATTDALLGLAVTASPDPVTAGTVLSVDLAVTNSGPATATGVTVTGAVPNNTSFSPVGSASICEESVPGTITCTFPDIVAGDIINANVNFVVDASAPNGSTVSFTGTVDGAENDPDASDDSSSDASVVNLATDLDITKTPTNGHGRVGETYSFTITSINNGPSDSTNTGIGDFISPETTFNPALSDPRCSSSVFSPDFVFCNVGTVASGASESVVVTLNLNAAGVQSDSASTFGDGADPDGNSASASVTVGSEADVAISKTPANSVGVIGGTANFTIGATNNGPDTASNVVITDQLAAGTSFNAGASDPNCTLSGSVVSCPVGNIASGGSATATVVVDLNASGTQTDTASYTSGTFDTDNSNNSASATVEVAPSANLAIDKMAPALVSPGAQFTYRIEVTNQGPDDVVATVTDVLPPGVTFVVASIEPGTPNEDTGCQPTGGVLTCTLNATTDAITVMEITVIASSEGDQVNNVSIASDEATDPDTTDNADQTTTLVANNADLDLTKTAPATANAGESMAFILGVTNNGPEPTESIVVTDELPAGATFNPEDSSPECTEEDGTVTCALFPGSGLGVGDSISFTVVVALAQSTANTVVSNTATVSGLLPDADASNDSDTSNTAVGAESDVSITKQAPPTALTGEQVNFQLTVANDGPSTATDVVVSDALPAGVDFVFVNTENGAPCQETAGIVTCQLGDLAPGSGDNIVIQTTANQAGTVNNTATVDSSSSDQNQTNNSSSVEVVVSDASTDLAIDKSAPATADAGEFITYTLDITNNGPNAATGVLVEDTLPAGTQLVETDGAPCTYNPPVVTCDLGTVGVGVTEAVTITVIADPDRAGTTLTNTASVDGDEADPNTGNNSDSANTTLDPAADVSISKNVNQAAAGGDATYTLVVTNTGPNTAEDVTVSDSLPEGVSFRSLTTSQGECNNFEATRECEVGALNPGASAQVRIIVRVDDNQAGNTITNTSSVRASTDDPDTSNNQASASFTALPANARKVDLEVNKTLVTENPRLGRPIEYRITVTNNGPDQATDIEVTDTMNRDVEVISTDASEGTCSSENGVITCQGAQLEVGETLAITVIVRPLRLGELTNTASATALGAEQAQADNRDVARAQIVTAAAARYSVKKTASDTTLKRGQKVKFTIRVRVRGGALQDLKVCDRLPRGFAYLKFRGGKLKKGRVCFTRKLARVGTYTYRITARVGAKARRRSVNTAVVDTAARKPKRSSVRLQVRGASDRAGGVTG